MRTPMITRGIDRGPRARHRRGQALIEATVGIVLFLFLGLMGYETAVLQHNLTLIQEAVREAAWVAARGGNDAVVQEMIADAGTRLISGALISHAAFSFGVEVWTDTYGASSLPWSAAIAPDYANILADSTFAPGSQTRAAYLYRAQGMAIRIGVSYTMVIGAPLFGTFQAFKVRVPMTASEPIVVRNDEDRDGMVDLYEQEVFARRGLLPDRWQFGIPASLQVGGWPRPDGDDTFWYFPYSHTDTGLTTTSHLGVASAVPFGVALSDAVASDIDGDGNSSETSIGNFEQYDYDYDNDGILDEFDYHADNGADSPQILRHPVFGGRPIR